MYVCAFSRYLYRLYMLVYEYVCVYLYFLLALFLWRILIDTLVLKTTSEKDVFCYLGTNQMVNFWKGRLIYS